MNTLNVESEQIFTIFPLSKKPRVGNCNSELFMSTANILNSKVYETIYNKPGIHFNEICRELNRKNGVIDYHLNILEEENAIKSFNDGYFTLYYPVTVDISEECFKLLALLKRSAIENTIKILISDTEKCFTRRELAEINGVTPQAISNTMKLLISQKLVKEKAVTRQKYFCLTEKALDLLNELGIEY